MGRRSAEQLRLVTTVWLLQVSLAAALRVLRVPVLRRRLGRLRPLARAAAGDREERVIWAIEAVGRRLPRVSSCFVRAIVAELLLATPDRPGRLMIGVRHGANGRLEAHAWFERDGRVLVGGADCTDYVPFVTLRTCL